MLISEWSSDVCSSDLPLFLAMLPFYIFGRAYDFLLIEAGALFGAMGALFYGRFGAGVMRRHWFPFLYMAFLIPPPGWAVNYLTAPLKTPVRSEERRLGQECVSTFRSRW